MEALNISINGDQALEALARVVADAGDGYKDPYSLKQGMGCRYVRSGKPSCIVGRALAELGVPLQVLKNLDNTFDSTIQNGGYGFLRGNGVLLDAYAAEAFAYAQGAQDGGDLWSVALDKAREQVQRMRTASMPK